MERRTGRPRDAAAGQAILAAARDLLLTRGYGGLAVDEVTARAGVAKTTLYRRWPGKDHLVVAVLADLQRDVPVPDTGDVAADLGALVRALAALLDEAPMRRLVAELAAASARDAALAEAVARLWADRRGVSIEVLRRAIARGALRADVDPEVLVDQLAGALYYRVLITGAPLGGRYPDDLVRAVLRGALPGDVRPLEEP